MRPISRAEMARTAGVSKQAISKACKKELAPACQGDRVDLDHPAVAVYLKRQGKEVPPVRAPRAAARPPGAPTSPRKGRASAPPPAPRAPTPKAKGPPGRPRKPTRDTPDDEREEVGHLRPREGVHEGSNEDLRDLTDCLMPLVERFGTDLRFSDWLSSLKDIELIREKRLKNGETEGGLISRELVKQHVLGAVESANKRLLGDAAKTIAAKVANIIRSGGGLEEAQRAVREEISKQLKPVKDKAARNLRHKADGPKK
jgi:hypothetical protein